MSASDSYLETQVLTATPQRLRLMLIDEALRRVRSAAEFWGAGQRAEGDAAAARAREVFSELIGGIHPDETTVAKQVLGIYVYMFSVLIEAGSSADHRRLADVIRILEEERQTWQEVCQSFSDRPVPSAPIAVAEELAPSVVAPHFSSGYSSPGHSPASSHAPPAAANASFSIDA